LLHRFDLESNFGSKFGTFATKYQNAPLSITVYDGLSYENYASVKILLRELWSQCLLKDSGLVVTDQEVRVRFPALPVFLRSSGSGTGSTQNREYN
jgi:hypothetical protein